jgi:UDP-2,3-diacylglucosamine hydrolase
VRLVDLGQTKNLWVVSDVHMRTPDDARAQAFCGLLDSLSECDVLVLLGDIFDFINARQQFYFHHWRHVFNRLRRLKEQGVRIVFVEGNHDYGFEHSPCREIRECFDVCGDSAVRVFHPVVGNVLMLHSDNVVCPPSYRAFRAVVKSRVFQSLLSPIPGFATSYLFSRYAQISRSKDKYRELSTEFLTDCVDSFLSTQQHVATDSLAMCVFGHIHVHLDDKRKDVRFLSGPDWFTAPNALSLNEGGQVLRHWLNSNLQVPLQIEFEPQKEPLLMKNL